MKRLTGILLVGVMLFFVAACSGNGNGGGASSPPEATPSAQPSPDAANPPAEGSDAALEAEPGASLLIWEDDNQFPFLEEMSKEFEAQYGVSVKIEKVPPTDQVTKLTTDGPAGIAADVLVFPHDQIGRAASAGLILPNDVFEEDVRSNNQSNAVSAVTFEDQLYGYPYSVETYALIYNKQLIPEAPKSFEEIIEFAKSFNDTKSNKYAIMWELQQFYYNFAFLATTGGYMFGDNNTNKDDIGMNNDGAIAGGQFMQTLQRDVLPLKTGDVDYDIKKGLFTTGNLAMDINGPWALTDYREAGIDIGVAPVPSINGNPFVSFSGVKAYYVNSYSQYPNAAKLFANFLSSKEAQLKNFEMNGILPSNTEVAEDPKVKEDSVTIAFLEQFDNSTPMPAIPQMGSVWNPMTAGIAEIWDEGKDVKETLDKAVNNIHEGIASTQ